MITYHSRYIPTKKRTNQNGYMFSSYYSPFNSPRYTYTNHIYKRPLKYHRTQHLNNTEQGKQIRFSDFAKGKLLGEGKFGQIFRCIHKQTGTIYAIKIIKKKQILKQKYVDQLINQIKCHLFISHSNIITLYFIFHDSYNIYLVQQLAIQGSLQLLNNRINLSQKVSLKIIKEILSAVAYLHQKNIIHRDIKPSNIIITFVLQLYQGVFKICDFGWAVQSKKVKSQLCGTINYVSPQVAKGEAVTQKTDIWSIGVMLYEMIFKENPFQSRSIYQTFQNILHIIPKTNIQIIQKAMQKQPKNRPSAQQMFKLI